LRPGLQEGHTMAISDELVAVDPPERREIDPELVDRLLEQAGDGVELLGPDGLLTELTKSVLDGPSRRS
jgi:hypothetical protein